MSGASGGWGNLLPPLAKSFGCISEILFSVPIDFWLSQFIIHACVSDFHILTVTGGPAILAGKKGVGRSGEVGQYRGKPGQGLWGLRAVGRVRGDGGTQGWIG